MPHNPITIVNNYISPRLYFANSGFIAILVPTLLKHNEYKYFYSAYKNVKCCSIVIVVKY